MATTKLTLSVDAATVEWAKKYAQEKHISLSKLFQNHLKDIAANENQPDPLLDKLKNMQIPEHIKALAGF